MLAVVPLALVLLIIVGLVAKNASVVMYALLAYTPINQLLPEGIPYREIPEMLRFAAFMGVLCLFVIRGRSFRKLFWGDRLAKLALLWFAIIVITLIASGDYTAWAERTVIRYASYTALFFAFRGWLTTPAQLRRCWSVISWVIFLCGAFALVQIMAGGLTPLFALIHPNSMPTEGFQGRAFSFVSSGVNAFGGMMGILIPFEMALLGSAPSRHSRIRHIVVLVFGLVGVILSGSRGAALTMVSSAALAAYYFQTRRIVRILALGTLFFGLPVAVALAAFLSPRMTNVDEDSSIAKRYEIWNQAWILFRANPILGIGIGNFRESYDAAALSIEQGSVDTHNVYLLFMTETGLVGLAIFLWVSWELLFRNFKNLRRYPPGSMQYAMAYVCLAATLAMLVHGFVDVLFSGSTEFGAAFYTMFAFASKYEHLNAKRALEPAGTTTPQHVRAALLRQRIIPS